MANSKNSEHPAKEALEPESYNRARLWAIFEIIKNTSEECPLKQSDILHMLKDCYGFQMSKNGLRKALDELCEFYNNETFQKLYHNGTIEYSETKKSNGVSYKYRYYFKPAKPEGELLSSKEILKVANTIAFSRIFDEGTIRRIINELKTSQSLEKHDREKIDNIQIPDWLLEGDEIPAENLLKLQALCTHNETRKNYKWASFIFTSYDENLGLLPEKSRTRMLPLYIGEYNHKYYLLGLLDETVTEGRMANSKGPLGSQNYQVSTYRVDLMRVLRECNAPKNLSDEQLELIKNTNNTFFKNFSRYLSEHLFMFYGDPEEIEIEIPKADPRFHNTTFMVDYFGERGILSCEPTEDDSAVRMTIKVVPEAFANFIMLYADKKIKVLGPEPVKSYIDDLLVQKCNKVLGNN